MSAEEYARLVAERDAKIEMRRRFLVDTVLNAPVASITTHGYYTEIEMGDLRRIPDDVIIIETGTAGETCYFNIFYEMKKYLPAGNRHLFQALLSGEVPAGLAPAESHQLRTDIARFRTALHLYFPGDYIYNRALSLTGERGKALTGFQLWNPTPGTPFSNGAASPEGSPLHLLQEAMYDGNKSNCVEVIENVQKTFGVGPTIYFITSCASIETLNSTNTKIRAFMKDRLLALQQQADQDWLAIAPPHLSSVVPREGRRNNITGAIVKGEGGEEEAFASTAYGSIRNLIRGKEAPLGFIARNENDEEEGDVYRLYYLPLEHQPENENAIDFGMPDGIEFLRKHLEPVRRPSDSSSNLTLANLKVLKKQILGGRAGGNPTPLFFEAKNDGGRSTLTYEPIDITKLPVEGGGRRRKTRRGRSRRS